MDTTKSEAAPQAANPEPSEDLLDQIVKLGELRDKGILTEEEFSSQKQKILNFKWLMAITLSASSNRMSPIVDHIVTLNFNIKKQTQQ